LWVVRLSCQIHSPLIILTVTFLGEVLCYRYDWIDERTALWVSLGCASSDSQSAHIGLGNQTGSKSLSTVFNIISTSNIEGLCCLVCSDLGLILKLWIRKILTGLLGREIYQLTQDLPTVQQYAETKIYTIATPRTVFEPTIPDHEHKNKKKPSMAFSPQANYTDRATAACRRS
jgi:hypothetical protein